MRRKYIMRRKEFYFMLNEQRIDLIDEKLFQLYNQKEEWKRLAIALDIADEIMKGILPKNGYIENYLTRNALDTGFLPNALPLNIFSNNKQFTWFREHPYASSARIALEHFKSEIVPLESHFFWFSDKLTKEKVATTTQLTLNWEDSDVTKNETSNVGIDFILTSDSKSILMVVSNKQNLRIMEISQRLSNTQKLIFKNSLFNIFNENHNISRELIHNKIWEALKVSEVNNKFYNGISKHFDELMNYLYTSKQFSEVDAKQFSIRLLGRLLFIWFLRKMNAINENYGYFDDYKNNSSEYYEKKLKVLFFNTLNTPLENRKHFDYDTPYLNGGLFHKHENDHANMYIRFPNRFFETLFNHFEQFNFTIDEASPEYEFIAVNPEMLGRVFESLLQNKVTEESLNDRNDSGSFYTPREVVDYMCKEALRKYLKNNVDVKYYKGIDDLMDLTDLEFMKKKTSSKIELWGVNSVKVKNCIIELLDNIKIIDPAVGSGAFPIGVLQIMTRMYERLSDKSINKYKMKMQIIENNIYGVDIQPIAIEIARLRTWLSIIVEEQNSDTIHTLPNLEFKFISANSLKQLDTNTSIWDDPKLDTRLSEIRKKYFNARTPESKSKHQKMYLKAIGNNQMTIEMVKGSRSGQLQSFNPFNNNNVATFFDSKFMFGIENGFDIIIGNPPYSVRFSDIEKKQLKKRYPDVPDFESSNYFILDSKRYLKKGGQLSFIIPNMVLTNVNAKNMRKNLLNNWKLTEIINFSDQQIFEQASVRNIILNIENIESDKSQKTAFIDGIFKEEQTLVTLNYSELKERINSWLNIFYQSPDIYKLLNKIQKDTKYLKEYVEVSQGLIPYDVKAGTPEHVKKNKLYHSDFQKDETFKQLLEGKDVKKYYVEWNEKKWISYGEWLGNCRKKEYFTKPRLLIREITSPTIYCAYTEKEFYNTVSIINVINKTEEISLFYILAIINSKVFNFYHRKNSPKSNKGIYPKILVRDIKNLPLKREDFELENKINDTAKDIYFNGYSEKKQKVLDKYIYLLYKLNDEEIKIVETVMQE